MSPEDRVSAALPEALRLVTAVREQPATVARALQGMDLPAVCIALARLVPDDRTIGELLEWTGRGTGRPVCGSDPGWHSHHRRQEPPCGPCTRAHETVREIEARRRWRRRQQATVQEIGGAA